MFTYPTLHMYTVLELRANVLSFQNEKNYLSMSVIFIDLMMIYRSLVFICLMLFAKYIVQDFRAPVP